MPIRVNNPLIQSLLEAILTEEELQHLLVNPRSNDVMNFPTSDQYLELIRAQVAVREQRLNRCRALLTAADASKAINGGTLNGLEIIEF